MKTEVSDEKVKELLVEMKCDPNDSYTFAYSKAYITSLQKRGIKFEDIKRVCKYSISIVDK